VRNSLRNDEAGGKANILLQADNYAD